MDGRSERFKVDGPENWKWMVLKLKLNPIESKFSSRLLNHLFFIQPSIFEDRLFWTWCNLCSLTFSSMIWDESERSYKSSRSFICLDDRRTGHRGNLGSNVGHFRSKIKRQLWPATLTGCFWLGIFQTMFLGFWKYSRLWHFMQTKYFQTCLKCTDGTLPK